MFATIVPHYDLVNTLMTFGLDRRWRRATVVLAEPMDAVALDIATGTGELAFELARQGARIVVGVDFCHEMVEGAVRKGYASGDGSMAPPKSIVFATGDAMALPFADCHLRLYRQWFHAAKRRRSQCDLRRTVARA